MLTRVVESAHDFPSRILHPSEVENAVAFDCAALGVMLRISPDLLEVQRIAACTLLILFALFLVSCGRHAMSVTRASSVAPISKRAAYTNEEYKSDLKEYEAEQDRDKQREKRDAMALRLMGDIDESFGRYDSAVFSGRGLQGSVADGITLGLSAAATIATPPGTKTVFSALATAVGGINLSIDKNFYATQSFQVLSTAMSARREEVRAEIYARLANDDTRRYPWQAARTDLIRFFNAGTLVGGLQQIQRLAGVAADKAKEDVAAGKRNLNQKNEQNTKPF